MPVGKIETEQHLANFIDAKVVPAQDRTREVQSSLQAQITDLSALQTDLAAAEATLAIAVFNIAVAQADITAAQADIVATQADLTAAQADLATAVSDIAATQAALNRRGVWERLASQTISSGSADPVDMDTQTINVGGFSWSAGTNPSRVTVPATGVYLVTGATNWTSLSSSGSAAVTVESSIRVNGTVFATDLRDVAAAAAESSNTIAQLTSLTASDYVELVVRLDALGLGPWTGDVVGALGIKYLQAT